MNGEHKSLRNGNEQIWTDEILNALTQRLSTVLLEEWGGPRSPLALEYIRNTIIPDFVNCFIQNSDLLTNVTFAEIVSWKLKSQYAYPPAVVTVLTEDLLKAVHEVLPQERRVIQSRDPKGPWRRIFRLWVCGETLPGIEEKTGYPLAYLDLLFIRLKKLRSFHARSRLSLLECLENPELREYGLEQLSFLYQFHNALSSEPLFKERLILEQVILELGRPLQVPDLVALLEIVHAHEGKIEAKDLSYFLRKDARKPSINDSDDTFPDLIEGLIELHFLQRNKSGRLMLSEKSALTLAAFLAPKIVEQVRMAVAAQDFEQAKQILLDLNPEILVKTMDAIVDAFSPDDILVLIESIFKQVNRRIDLHLLPILSMPIFKNNEKSFGFLLSCLGDKDNLIRAKACEGLGQLGNKDAVFSLIQLLKDPVAGVKEMAAQALGDIGSLAALKPLGRVAEDYSESTNVRGRVRDALRKIEALQMLTLKVTE